MPQSIHELDDACRRRLGQFDRVLGAVFHDLGNTVLPSRSLLDGDDDDADPELRPYRRNLRGLRDHLLTTRSTLDQLRGGGGEAKSMALGAWWGQNARLLRAALRHGPVLRLETSHDEQMISPAPFGRLLLMLLIALDEQTEITDPLIVDVNLDVAAVAVRSSEPLTFETPAVALPLLAELLVAVGGAVVGTSVAGELIRVELAASAVRA